MLDVLSLRCHGGKDGHRRQAGGDVVCALCQSGASSWVAVLGAGRLGTKGCLAPRPGKKDALHMQCQKLIKSLLAVKCVVLIAWAVRSLLGMDLSACRPFSSKSLGL